MNPGALSLENVPGFWTPVRFFLTVPVFGVIAAAIILLVPVLILFGTGVLVAIFKAGNARTTARAVQLAALGLIVTVVIGGVAESLVNKLSCRVSEQVIPMFLTTPPYPDLLNKRLVFLLMLLLCAGSLLPLRGLEQVAVVLVSILMLAYATVTLYLLAKRRRKRFDITNWFWRVGMLCLVLGAGINVCGYFGGTFAGAIAVSRIRGIHY